MAGSKIPHWQRVAVETFMQIRNHPDFDVDIQAIRNIRKYAKSNPRSIAELAQTRYTNSTDYLVNKNLERMVQKYEAPRALFQLLRSYLYLLDIREEDGDTDISEEELEQYMGSVSVMPPLFLVSGPDNSVTFSDSSPNNSAVYEKYADVVGDQRVMIELTQDVQQEDLIDYIKLNYKTIERKLELLDPDRVRRTKSKQLWKRDYAIIAAYKELKADPHFHRKIYGELVNRTKVSEETIRVVIKHYLKQRKMWAILIN